MKNYIKVLTAMYESTVLISRCLTRLLLLNSPGADGADETQSVTEVTVLKVECDVISMMDPTPGKLEITTKNLHFFGSGVSGRPNSSFRLPFMIVVSRHYSMARPTTNYREMLSY